MVSSSRRRKPFTTIALRTKILQKKYNSLNYYRSMKIDHVYLILVSLFFILSSRSHIFSLSLLFFYVSFSFVFFNLRPIMEKKRNNMSSSTLLVANIQNLKKLFCMVKSWWCHYTCWKIYLTSLDFARIYYNAPPQGALSSVTSRLRQKIARWSCCCCQL
jgi:hypothetical protein